MRDSENIRQVASLGIDWIGLIFWPKSPRYVSMIPTLVGTMPDRTSLSPVTAQHSPQRVGVFVDPMAQDVITHVVNFQLDLVQMHGHETPTLIRNLRRTLDDIRPVKFIKAISVSSRDDIATYKDYEDCVDYFLFDTRSPLPGGSGHQFDWRILRAYNGPVSFLLSGGIGPDDLPRVLGYHHPRCIGFDLNSRFEISPAHKDPSLLDPFIKQIKLTYNENVR
jgi:phosphoribosylanthranilate isomerase